MKLLINFVLQNKSRIKFLFGTPLTILALGFIFSSFYSRLDTILPRIGQINALLLISSVLLFACFFFLKGLVWVKIIEFLGVKPNPLEDIYFLSTSEIKRYIPGSIFAFVNRVAIYSGKQSARSTLKGILLEQLLLVLSSLTVSIPALLYFAPILEQRYSISRSLLVGVCVVVIVLTVSGLYYLYSKQGLKRITLANIFSLASMYGLSVISWTIFGVASYLTVTSFTYLDPILFLQLCAFFVLAWLIGYLSFVTPMGLGVREAVIAAGLVSFVPTLAIASFIAILLRIIFTLSELVFLAVFYLLQKYKTAINFIESKDYFYKMALVIIAAVYSILFSYFSIDRHNNFYTGRYDLGNMDQTVWNTLNGRLFMFTNPDTGQNVSRLTFHSDFLLVLLAPFYLVWNDPRTLLIIQSIAISLGVFFVYSLAKEVLKNKDIAFALAAAYLLNPFLQRQNIYDFHAVSLASTFLLAAFYFLYSKRWAWGVVFLALSVLSKENIFIITFLMGVYLVISKKNVKLGAAVAVTSGLAFIFIMKVLIPNVRGGSHFALQFLSYKGDSLEQVVLNIIVHPIQTISTALDNHGVFYVFRLLLPLGFLSILGLPFLAFAVPDIFKNLLANNSNFRDIYYQYMAEITPFVYISAIFGIKLVASKFKKLPPQFVILYILVFSLIAFWYYSPLPGTKRANLANFREQLPNRNEIKAVIATIDLTKSVSATNNLGAHVAHRQNLYTFPNATESADVVLFLLRKNSGSYDSELEGVVNLQENSKYKLDKKIGDFYMFERIR